MISLVLYLIDFTINQVNFEDTNYRAIFTEVIVIVPVYSLCQDASQGNTADQWRTTWKLQLDLKTTTGNKSRIPLVSKASYSLL